MEKQTSKETIYTLIGVAIGDAIANIVADRLLVGLLEGYKENRLARLSTIAFNPAVGLLVHKRRKKTAEAEEKVEDKKDSEVREVAEEEVVEQTTEFDVKIGS